jgi:hypothetical protein
VLQVAATLSGSDILSRKCIFRFDKASGHTYRIGGHNMWLYEPKQNYMVLYHEHDESWAEWVGWYIEELGFTVRLEPWEPDYQSDLTLNWASEEADRIVILLSQKLASDLRKSVDELTPDAFKRQVGIVTCVFISDIQDNNVPAIDWPSLSLVGLTEAQARVVLRPVLDRNTLMPKLRSLLADTKYIRLRRASFPGATDKIGTTKWDVFLAYSPQDFEHIAMPLANELGKRHSLRVAMLGDGMDLSVEEGVTHSRCTVPIISPGFLGSDWPKERLWSTLQHSSSKTVDVLPIIAGMDQREVPLYVPTSKWDLSLSVGKGNRYLAEAVAALVRGTFETPTLLGPDGRPLTPNSDSYKRIVSSVSSVSTELLRQLARNPGELYQLSSRLFEEVVSELLNRQGYEVTLTPSTRDGGKDIYAAQHNAFGRFLYIVECKRYAPDNHVGVGVLRQLYGVVEAERVNAGIIATTSFFSSDAKEFQQTVPLRIKLRDYLGIQEWLKVTGN